MCSGEMRLMEMCLVTLQSALDREMMETTQQQMQMWVCVVDRSRGNKHDIHTAKFWEWQMHLNVGVNYIKESLCVCVQNRNA